MAKIIIIGNGIAGTTAARHIRKKSDHEITLISGETDYFFSRTALMYIYMGHMKLENTQPYENWFWEKNRIDLKKGWVKNIDTSNQTVLMEDGSSHSYDKLVLALGSKPNKFGWPGQNLKGVSGMYSYQDLESIEQWTKDIDRGVIVGGGLIGIELAEMLHSRGIPVTFLVREKSFWDIVLPPEESEMINEEIRKHHIDLRLETELKEIKADENGRAKSIITNHGEEIVAQFVGLTAGVSSNKQLAVDSGIETERGIMVDDYLQTSVENVYAIGDCVQLRNPLSHRRAIEQVWYTGRMMGEAVAETICNTGAAYKPGIWFNSAKFFNIEYQTYGTVNARKQENEEHFVWQNDAKDKLVRIVFDKNTQEIIGVNTFGIRMRHEVWDQWFVESKSVFEVVDHLKKANFDPEFFTRYEKDIIQSFYAKYEALKATT